MVLTANSIRRTEIIQAYVFSWRRAHRQCQQAELLANKVTRKADRQADGKRFLKHFFLETSLLYTKEKRQIRFCEKIQGFERRGYSPLFEKILVL